jgi:hypothetical protein
VAMRVAASKSVAASVALLTVVACQAHHPSTATNPRASTSQSARATSTHTQALSYPKDHVSKAVAGGRFVATFTIDHGTLTIGPPPAGPPAMSERAAMNRFWTMRLGPISGPPAYGSVTLVPRPLALVRLTDEPAWVIMYQGPPIPMSCPYHKTRRAPLSLLIAIVPTDGSRGVQFTSAGRSLCGWWTPTRATWA